MNRSIQYLCLILLTVILNGCSTPQPTTIPRGSADSIQVEAQEWPTADPGELGLDSDRLARAAERAAAINLHSLLVIRDGKLVSENYYGDNNANTRHELYSVTKSFTATLVGIAVSQGAVAGPDTGVLETFPEIEIDHSDPLKSGMTLRHLLTMTSGLDWAEGDPVYRAMYLSPDWVRFVLEIPMREPPGSAFNYCSGCSHLLSAAVQKTVGMNMKDFATAHLFQPLGITHVNWDTDSEGIPIGGWGLQLTPRDMAKLGQLYLQGGVWKGEQVVPAEWIAAATRVQVETGEGWGYGYQWWIDNEHAAYAARGRYGQIIYVVPDLELVVVSTAAAESDAGTLELIYEEIIPAVQGD